jgi:hypothetical protein
VSRPDVHQQVHQLCLNTTHHAVIDHDTHGATIHTTESPSLLEQLETASNTADGTNGAGGYKSRPAAWLEPLDTLALIDQESSAWVRKLGDDDPPTTKECVLRLHGLWASADDDTKKAIERDVSRWWTQARIVSGWDSAAWRPDNTCPMCNERRSLRVKLSDQSAFCVDCRETWTPENIGLLAEHIRQENFDTDDETEGDAA